MGNLPWNFSVLPPRGSTQSGRCSRQVLHNLVVEGLPVMCPQLPVKDHFAHASICPCKCAMRWFLFGEMLCAFFWSRRWFSCLASGTKALKPVTFPATLTMHGLPF